MARLFYYFRWVILALSLSAVTAEAQQRILVRSGDHKDYSRLVFPLAQDRAWELRTSGRRVTLSLSDTSIEFDTSTVFDRIARTRIIDIKSENVGNDVFVRLSLGCSCSASAKVEGTNLIIDVAEKTAGKTPSTQASTAPPSSPREDEIQSEEPQWRADRPLSRPMQRTSSPERPDEGSASLAELQTKPANISDVSERLRQQLEKAASQGLIEIANEVETSLEEPEIDIEIQMEDADPEPSLEPSFENIDGLAGVAPRADRALLETIEANPSLNESVRVTVPEGFEGLDFNGGRGPKKEISSDEEEQLTQSCYEDDYLDIANWSDGRSFSDQFSEMQSKVFGEFDDPDDEVAFELVKLYLYFGLGTEAEKLIEDVLSDNPQAMLFLELAGVVEGKSFVPGGELDETAGCKGLVELWRTAAIDEDETQPINEPELLVNDFAEFPIEIRRLIGPRLVQSFITRDQLEEANTIFSIVDRAPGHHGDDHIFIGAKLKLLFGQTEEGEEILWLLINKGAYNAVEAAILLADSLIARGATVPEDLIQLIETMAFEHRDTKSGLMLRLAEIFAKSGSNQLLAALDVAAAEMNSHPDFERDYLFAVNQILAQTTLETTGDASLMRSFFTHKDLFLADTTEPETKFHLAKLFLETGLPNQAMEMLNAAPNPDDLNAREIRAKAYLQLNQAEKAIALSTGAGEAIPAKFLIDAFSKRGDYDESLKIASSQPEAKVDRHAWHAGSWGLATSSSDETVSALAQYMLKKERANGSEGSPVHLEVTEDDPIYAIATPSIEPTEISLEYSQALSRQSQMVRTFLADALSGI